MGGAKLAATVIEAGLVDKYRANILPVLIGSGTYFSEFSIQGDGVKFVPTRKIVA